MKEIIALPFKALGRVKCSWHLFYGLMLFLSASKRLRFWRFLERNGIAHRMCDEGFYKMRTLAWTGEKYALPGKGGGIYSAINWQRLYWDKEIPRICTDKLSVREYVRERIGDEYLIPIVPNEKTYWTDADSFSLDGLPDRFVLKLNNGSGMNLLVNDRDSLDLPKVRATLRKWLASDFSKWARERQYEKIANKVYCEAMIDTPNGKPPDDYKIMCTDGKPLFIWVDSGRLVNHQRSFFDLDFKKYSVRVAHDNIDHEIPKPRNLDVMLDIASKLSKGIPIVRIDLYNVDGRIYFGEMTFTSAACMERYEPLSFSIGIGNQIDLKPFINKEK